MSSKYNINHRTILVVGASAWDRLVFVEAFPRPDAKIKSTAYYEGGGGNAANAAHALALLLSKNHDHQFSVELASRIGTDAVGQQVRRELETAGVILGKRFVQGPTNSTSSFTTILVDQMAATRTCIFTYGSCGELENPTHTNNSMDIEDDLLVLFPSTIHHLHSDSRHTNAALSLARQARRQGIPISLDVEKDRHSRALDNLLPLVDIVFTNDTLQIHDYLERLHEELSTQHHHDASSSNDPTKRERVVPPQIYPEFPSWINDEGHHQDSSNPGSNSHDTRCQRLTTFLAKVLRPSIFWAYWYPRIGQQVIITKGALGAVHVCCTDISSSTTSTTNTASSTLDTAATLHLSQASSTDLQEYTAIYTINTRREDDTQEVSNIAVTFVITLVGVSNNVSLPIGDPTGAGDAFVAGYLAALYDYDPTSIDGSSSGTSCWNVLTRLQFATWVAGKKLRGPGARSSLPTKQVVFEELGSSPQQIAVSLSKIVTKMDLEQLE